MRGNDGSIGALGSEIRVLCMRVGRLLGTDVDMEVDDDEQDHPVDVRIADAVEMDEIDTTEESSAAFKGLRYDGVCFDDISSYLGKTLKELEAESKSPLFSSQLKEIIDHAASDLPSGFVGDDFSSVTLRRGELVFFIDNIDSMNGYYLAQVLDKYVTFNVKNVSNIPVRLCIGYGKYFRVHLTSNNFMRTSGLAWRSIASSDEYFFSDNTFADQVKKDILSHTFNYYNPVAFSRLGELPEYGSKKISRFLNNVRTGSDTYTVNGPDGAVFINCIQVVMNCFVVLSHWIRYDLIYVGKSREDEDFMNKCKTIAFSDTDDMKFYRNVPISDQSLKRVSNLFSLEACINDWKYLFIQRIAIHAGHPEEKLQVERFKEDIGRLLRFNDRLKRKGYRSIAPFLNYVISGAKRTIDIDHAYDFFSAALDMAVEKTLYSQYTTSIVDVRNLNFSIKDIISNVDDTDEKFQVVMKLIGELGCKSDDDTLRREIIDILHANSCQIDHMSFLKKNDFILIDNNVVAKVKALSFVDPFISVYNELNEDRQWKSLVDNERLVEDQNQTFSQYNLEYITNRMKAVLVLLPNGGAGVGTTESSEPPIIKFARDSRFFSVLSIQLTYEVVSPLELDDTLRIQTTMDFTRIRLLGCSGRKIGSSIVGMYNESENSSLRCAICHRAVPSAAWRHSDLCGHVYHMECALVNSVDERCPVCLKLTGFHYKNARRR